MCEGIDQEIFKNRQKTSICTILHDPTNAESFHFFLSDVNECFLTHSANEIGQLSHNCHTDANCTNTKGSFLCTCLNGFSGNGVNCLGRSLKGGILQG